MKNIKHNNEDSKFKITEEDKSIELTYLEILQMYVDIYNLKPMSKEDFEYKVIDVIGKFGSCEIKTLQEEVAIRNKGELYTCYLKSETKEYSKIDTMIDELYEILTKNGFILDTY